MHMTRLITTVALLALGTSANAARHSWLLPSAATVAGANSWVTVDASTSEQLFTPGQPIRLEAIKVWQPDGSAGTLQNGATGRFRSVFDLQLDKPGTWRVGTTSTNVIGSFKLDGEERRVGNRFGGRPGGPGGPGRMPGGPGPQAGASGRDGPGGRESPGGAAGPGGFRGPPPVAVADIPANATEVKLTEIVTTADTFVTSGVPTTTVFTPTGKGLEFQPITHPDDAVKGDAARYRFLLDGRPAANLKVSVIPGGMRYRDKEGGQELTTGADGIVTIDWPAPGPYWVGATTSDTHPSEPRATERRLTYGVVIDVAAP